MPPQTEVGPWRRLSGFVSLACRKVGAMEVRRKVAVPASAGCVILSVNTAYAQAQGRVLIRHYGKLFASDTISGQYEMRSADNGANWSDPQPIYEQEKTERGTRIRGESCLFRDEVKNRVLHFYNDQLYPAGAYTGEANKYTRIFMRVLDESGTSFSDPVQIVQDGYDETHWARDTDYGENCMMLSFCAALRTSCGHILLPLAYLPKTMDFSIKPVLGSYAGCFIGTWHGESLKWDLSQVITVDPAVSTAGLEEPTIAELGDGSLLMICRAGNRNIWDVPIYKWRSTSTDGGHTWSQAEPFPYDTGEPFFSFPSGSLLIRNRENGKLYWIGNISPRPTKVGDPRRPLHIAEVAEDRQAIIKESVRVIDARRQGDSARMGLSNFRVYEDRETHEFVLTMPRTGERAESDITSPAYEYRFKPE